MWAKKAVTQGVSAKKVEVFPHYSQSLSPLFYITHHTTFLQPRQKGNVLLLCCWPPHINPLPAHAEIEAGSVCFEGFICFRGVVCYFRTHLITFELNAKFRRLWDGSCPSQPIFTPILPPTLCRPQFTQHQWPSHIPAAQQQLFLTHQHTWMPSDINTVPKSFPITQLSVAAQRVANGFWQTQESRGVLTKV